VDHLKKAIIIYTHIVGIAIIRALGRRGVPVVAFYYSANEVGYLSRYVRERVRVPDPRKAENDFIEKLLDVSKRFEGSLLIPTDDYTLATLSKHKPLLEGRYTIPVGEWESVKNILEKRKVYKVAEELGVPCPRTMELKSIEEVSSFAQMLGYPCLIKPTEGHKFYDIFKAKMFKINSQTELLDKYNMVKEVGLEVMVQEIIPGDDGQGVNYNSYFVDGNPVAEFTAQKVRIDPPFFGSPRVIVSRRIPELIEPGRKLVRGLGYEGFSCTEFKRDVRDGSYKLMEINCRNNLTGSLAVYCGVDFPWIMYNHLVLGNVLRPGSLKFKENVYWIDITKDIVMFVTSRKEEGYTIKEYLLPYFKEKVFGILSFRDPVPFLKRCYYILRLIIQKFLGTSGGEQGEERFRIS